MKLCCFGIILKKEDWIGSACVLVPVCMRSYNSTRKLQFQCFNGDVREQFILKAGCVSVLAIPFSHIRILMSLCKAIHFSHI